MTQKTIKALYKQPVNYKLIRDGYKTIDGVIQAQDGMPKVVDLSVPSELYTTDLQYNVNTEVNGAPIITTSQFTLPDDEICEAKTYCYAPKGINYNYVIKQNVRHYDNFTVIGSPNINNNIVSGFSVNNRLQLVNMPTYSAGTITSFEFMFKVHTPETFTANGRLLNDFNSYDDVKLEVSSTGIAFNYGTSSAYIYTNSTPISTNTDYWIRVIYNNGTMSLDYSTDGINYSIAASAEIASNNIQILSSTFDIGARYYGNQDPGCTWAGSIDLSETYIKINNEYYWLPYRDIIEEVTIQIPGILDSSVTTDNWQQSQEYKLYQLKNQNNTDSLQLTENSITDTTQKYKQYINQLTIPARDYKWYYHYNVETGVYGNYNVIGSPIVNTTTGVVSGFSATNYLQLSEAFNPGNNPWEMIFRVKTSSDFSDLKNNITGSNTQSNYQAISCGVSKDHLFKLGISVNGSSWDPGYAYGTYYVLPETWYYIKIQFTGSHYQLYYSLDGNNYILDIDTISSLPVYQNNTPYLIGLNKWSTDSDSWYPWTGSIDLSESYIKINGNIWWSLMSIEDKWLANKSIYDYSTTSLCADTLDFTKSYVGVNDSEYHKYINPKVCLMPIDGGETITTYSLNATEIGNINFNTDTSMTSGFSNDDYLQLPEPFNPGNNPWEIKVKFSTDNSSTDRGILQCSSDSSTRWGVVLLLSSNWTLWFAASTDGANWDLSADTTQTLQPNSTYYVKIGWTGTEYYLNLSSDNETYEQCISIESTSHIYGSLGHTRLGSYYIYPYTSSIYLNDCYIKINDEIWWRGANSTVKEHQYITAKETINGCIYNYTDEGQEHQFDVYYDSNYTQPILVSVGESYSEGTKVDTITIPAHRTWDYQAGGNWSPLS